ncbi:MAG: LCP family protein [Tissierellia bacterium]|nr:LCP family protein [Tissierellia bacterium]
MKKIIKIILIALMILVGFYAIQIIMGLFSFSGVKDENKFDDEDLASGNRIEQRDKNELLFLFTGVDKDGSKVGTRTDTIMLVKANKSTKKIDIISIPRDTRCYVNGQLDKINAAHSYGGIDMTIKTIRYFLGIDLDYFVEVPFDAVVNVVDAMGGVDIDVNEQTAYAMGMNPGMHTFDGREALKYVRFRKGYQNADLGRINTQQDFMKQLFSQMMKPKNILKFPGVFKTASSEIDTNIKKTTMFSFAFAFRHLKNEDITTYTIPGEAEYIDDVSYYVAYPEETLNLRDQVLSTYVDN